MLQLQNSSEFGSSVSLKSSKSTVVTLEDDEVSLASEIPSLW